MTEIELGAMGFRIEWRIVLRFSMIWDGVRFNELRVVTFLLESSVYIVEFVAEFFNNVAVSELEMKLLFSP